VIAANVIYSRWHAAFFGLLAFLSALVWRLSKHKSVFPMIFLGLFAFHPAWWQDGGSGDCGIGMADNAFYLSGLGVMLLLTQLLHLSPPKVRWTLATALSLLVFVPIVVIGSRPAPVQPATEVALLNAAASGDLSKVKSLVSQGVSVDARRKSNPSTRWEPLKNAWTKLRWPDYPIQRGYTPLMLACVGGYRSTAEFLLDHGADVNATESDGGSSALTLALEYGHQNIVPLLAQHGATSEPLPMDTR
jgi:hypothetical protein